MLIYTFTISKLFYLSLISTSHFLLFCQQVPAHPLPSLPPSLSLSLSPFFLSSLIQISSDHSPLLSLPHSPQQSSDLPTTPNLSTYTIHDTTDSSHQSSRADHYLTLINGDMHPRQHRRYSQVRGQDTTTR